MPNKSVRENTKERIGKILPKPMFHNYFTCPASPFEYCTKEQMINTIKSLSTTLKPSWTELELDKILPKEILCDHLAVEGFQHDKLDCKFCMRNQAITDCKQALLKL